MDREIGIHLAKKCFSSPQRLLGRKERFTLAIFMALLSIFLPTDINYKNVFCISSSGLNLFFFGKKAFGVVVPHWGKIERQTPTSDMLEQPEGK